MTDLAAAEFATYDRLETSHWWFRARRAVLRTLLEAVPHHEDKTLLEVGCGAGGNLHHLFGDFKKRVGLECNQHALRHAREKLRPGNGIVAGDANELPLPNESFDCVALIDVLYHRAIRDVDRVLHRVRAVLKPGGHVLVTDGAHDFLAGRHNMAVDSARRFTKGRLRTHLEGSGFDILKISYWGVLIFGLLFAKRVVAEPLVGLFRSAPPEPGSFDMLTVPLLDQVLFASVRAELPFLRGIGLPLGASVCALARKT